MNFTYAIAYKKNLISMCLSPALDALAQLNIKIFFSWLWLFYSSV